MQQTKPIQAITCKSPQPNEKKQEQKTGSIGIGQKNNNLEVNTKQMPKDKKWSARSVALYFNAGRDNFWMLYYTEQVYECSSATQTSEIHNLKSIQKDFARSRDFFKTFFYWPFMP